VNDDERVLDAWCEATMEAWRLAFGARCNEVKGHHVKSFDSRGLHPYSEAWGKILALESLLPELAEVRDVAGLSVTSMRRDAATEATAELVAAIQRNGNEALR
jgi:hypothetical protein